MKTWSSLSKSGLAAAVGLASVWVLGSGCAQERVVYVPQAYTAPAAVPEAPPPPPEVTVSTAPVELPPAPPPAPVVALRSAAELDTMLAPIALYPDPLLAQILPAATLPAQVVLADRYLREGGDVNQVDAQPWDNSLKALARYPATLGWLDDNLAWTTELGQAFLNQPADVMDAVQRLRAQARALGNLVSTPQQTVVVDDDGAIEIVPAAPEVIYVPVYQPEVVYVQPPPAPGRFYVSFGAGLRIGAWLNHDCDWHQHEVIVWHHDHPRPVDWWYRPPSRRERPVVVNNITVVNNTRVNEVTVWHPRTRGTSGDRGWGQPKVQTPTPVRHEGTKPTTSPAPPTHGDRAAAAPAAAVNPKPVAPTREVQQPAPVPGKASSPRPSPPVEERGKPRPEPGPGTPTPAHEVKPAPRANPPVAAPRETRPAPAPAPKPPVAAPPAKPHAVATPPARVAAVNGAESSRVTREASTRGQQSRETIAKPVSAPRQAPVSPPKASPSEGKKAR